MKRLVILLIGVVIFGAAVYSLDAKLTADAKAKVVGASMVVPKASKAEVEYSFLISEAKILVKGNSLKINGRLVEPSESEKACTEATVGNLTVTLSHHQLVVDNSREDFPLLVRSVPSDSYKLPAWATRTKLNAHYLYATSWLETDTGKVRKFFAPVKHGNSTILLSQMSQQAAPKSLTAALASIR